ncbi:ATP-binding protein [Streptomyces sp. NBC_01477]|uniref:ATP-binding protein n=1 Tax=Streptomyces sp. NBC_01477 TaxID=2976015 RepID=UPI002E357CDD|nr:ATP-binding protein [Streptomyces sp. NBC_01477]
MTNLLEAAPPGARSTAQSGPGQLLIELELSAKSIHHAKTIARENVCLWGLDELATDIGLTLAELLTNVMRHAAPTSHGYPKVSRCLVQRVLGGIVVVVHDDDPSLPQEREVDVDSLDGRGLMLVRALAADVTVVPSPTGKDIVAVFTSSAVSVRAEQDLLK